MRRMHCRTRLLWGCSTTYRIELSAGANMGSRFMAGMVMVMRAVVARVVMVVCVGSTAMGVLMEMFVQVLMAIMGMFVGVRMSVVMSVQMLVFVLSFHN